MMKIIGVISARYASIQLQEKPLVNVLRRVVKLQSIND